MSDWTTWRAASLFLAPFMMKKFIGAPGPWSTRAPAPRPFTWGRMMVSSATGFLLTTEVAYRVPALLVNAIWPASQASLLLVSPQPATPGGSMGAYLGSW